MRWVFIGMAAMMVGAAPSVRDDIDAVVRQGRGTAEGRAAWERLSQAGPEAIPALLEALGTRDTVAANWLRTAFDRIVERELRAGGKRLDIEGLLRYVQDPQRPGRARRLTLDVVEQVRPG